jgi:D-sedoheptulose 7-phosphate isomerase
VKSDLAEMKKRVLKTIDESIATHVALKSDSDKIAAAADLVISCFSKDGKLLLFGNGGSAADAEHIAAEFVGRYRRERRAVPAIALSTNTPSLTSIGNDYGYDYVFQRQVEAFCARGDVVIGISTSGNSRNVLLGVKAAKKKGATAIGLTGADGGKLSGLVDLAIRVKSDSTPRIQEAHILIGHIISDLVEESLAGRRPRKTKFHV